MNGRFEALANYSSLLGLEKKKGVKEMASVLESYRTELLSKDAEGALYEAAGPIVWGESLAGWPNSGAWRMISYGKGHLDFAHAAAALRVQVGNLLFEALARELRPKGMALEVIDAFFHNWVYPPGFPR